MGGAKQAAKKSHRTDRVRFVGEGQIEIEREKVTIPGGMWVVPNRRPRNPIAPTECNSLAQGPGAGVARNHKIDVLPLEAGGSGGHAAGSQEVPSHQQRAVRWQRPKRDWAGKSRRLRRYVGGSPKIVLCGLPWS